MVNKYIVCGYGIHFGMLLFLGVSGASGGILLYFFRCVKLGAFYAHDQGLMTLSKWDEGQISHGLMCQDSCTLLIF